MGQFAKEEKSNEITSIQRLLKMLDITDSIITIDAMGCRKAIAKQIVNQKGHYVLQVKKNHAGLHEVIEEMFDELSGRGIPGVRCAFHEDVDAGHGRVETRRIWTTDWTKLVCRPKSVEGAAELCVRGKRS